MKVTINKTQEVEVDLSNEVVEYVLCEKIKNDYYDMYDSLEDEDITAMQTVYNFYTGKTLIDERL